MAKQNSTKWKILAATIAIDNITDLSIEVNNKLIEVTTKDSLGWEEFLSGLKGGSASFSGIVDYGSTGVSPDEIFTALVAGSAIAFECSDAVSGSKKLNFSGLYEKYSIQGATEDAIKFSVSVKATGVITQAAVI